MHDGGFYPDLEHVVQSTIDDDPSRPCNIFPALLKDPTKPPAPESISSHCCSIAHGYLAGDTGLYWEGGRRTSVSRAGGSYRSPAAEYPAVTTVVAADGTLLRSVRRGDHVYESASFAPGRCSALQHADVAEDHMGGGGGHLHSAGPTSVVYYEVDATGDKAVTRTPLMGAVTADILPVSRGQQSVI